MCKQVKISAPCLVAAAFKEACAAKDVSMASVLSEFMADFSNITVKKDDQPDYTTKRKRRAAVKCIIQQLNAIRLAEERYRDNIPENLQGSVVFDNAEQCIAGLEEAADLLDSY